MFVVQIVKYRERKPLQTDTTHKKKHTNKPEPQNKTLNIFSATDLYAIFVTVYLGLLCFYKKYRREFVEVIYR